MAYARAGSVTKYLTKKGERLWRYQFDGDPIDDKRRLIGKAGFATRAAASEAMQAAMKEYRESKTLPIAPPAPKETVADWVRAWLRDYAPQRCEPKTIERYHQLAGYILNATEGEPAHLALTPLAEVDHVIVEAALYALLRMKAKRRAHLSAKSVREIAAVLGVSLNKAFKLGKVTVNPLLRVELPKADKKEARSLTGEEVKRLREVCRGDWTFTLVEIALATGCRRGELLALEWADVDWSAGVVTVCKSLEETKAGIRVKRPKSNKPRKFRIGPSAIAALRFLQEQQAENRRLCGIDYREHDLVFCLPDGSYMLPHLVSQTIARRVAKAGIKDASLHTTRHTHASTLISRGVPLPAVSARLGHADTNITARIYSHALPEDDARAADTWEQVVNGPVQ